MPDPTGTLVDWLEEWHREEGWLCSKAEVARLVDEIGRLREQNTGLGVRVQEAWKRIDDLRSLLDHTLAHWRAVGKIAADQFADWDDTDWADSGWSGGEQSELRAAVGRVNRA